MSVVKRLRKGLFDRGYNSSVVMLGSMPPLFARPRHVSFWDPSSFEVFDSKMKYVLDVRTKAALILS